MTNQEVVSAKVIELRTILIECHSTNEEETLYAYLEKALRVFLRYRKGPAPFTNPRYEYTTREFPTEIEALTPDFGAVMKAEGWHQVWADVTVEGTFATFRRERKA